MNNKERFCESAEKNVNNGRKLNVGFDLVLKECFAYNDHFSDTKQVHHI